MLGMAPAKIGQRLVNYPDYEKQKPRELTEHNS